MAVGGGACSFAIIVRSTSGSIIYMPLPTWSGLHRQCLRPRRLPRYACSSLHSKFGGYIYQRLQHRISFTTLITKYILINMVIHLILWVLANFSIDLADLGWHSIYGPIESVSLLLIMCVWFVVDDPCEQPQDITGCYGECSYIGGSMVCRCPPGTQGNHAVPGGCLDSTLTNSGKQTLPAYFLKSQGSQWGGS